MNSQSGQPIGVNRIVEKPTAIDSVSREIQPAQAGKTMFQTISNSLEEFSSFLHKYKNLNRSRAKESRRGFDGLDVKKLSKSALSQHQVGKVSEVSAAIKQNRHNKSEVIEEIIKFSKSISSDITEKGLALLSLREQLDASNGAVPDISEIYTEIDRQLAPISRSLEFRAGVLSYGALDAAKQRGLDEHQLSDLTKSGHSISFGNIYNVLCDLREKFGDHYLDLGVGELYRKLSSQYHGGGRNIESSELISVMRNMSELKTLLALLDACRETARLLERPAADANAQNSLTSRLLSEVLSLQKKSWVESSDVSKMASNLNINNLAKLNILGVQARHIVSLVPDHIYGNAEQKAQCIETMFKCTDLFAQRESAYA
ncbi:TyeA family type III secretion system gatekeeper subunit [Microbulbifer variabilis]|uniref:TyeA family type III secretion system gatekeeper subunit n=1 Tax=Microbulbifer variabilis TaxID=266805 RepID=UPI001CFF3F82|nr:TyeA family type III secretion system gatekeeper subunit [Microbulbifer variabilis]